ncbi:hypothetical protein LTR09_003724 [Extremus antarcticus]|uniref:Uncharacterized protein n=1 Tax=Extremus antarcticus TaxID=702011 RepID=A0AAJ0DQX7_9PEZI|nr:hypothetical protein LTR09_003724 [Extremus antarcticus]
MAAFGHDGDCAPLPIIPEMAGFYLGEMLCEALGLLMKRRPAAQVSPKVSLWVLLGKAIMRRVDWKQPYMSAMWWRLHLITHGAGEFEQNYVDSWHAQLSLQGRVVWVNVFTAGCAARIPLLYDQTNDKIGNDRETFESIRMWYCLMQMRRGLSEIMLPRRLVRIDKVNVSAVMEEKSGNVK